MRLNNFGYKTKSKDSEKSLSDLYGVKHTAIVYKLQLLDLPKEIVTQIQNSYQTCNSSDKNSSENVTQVTNLTETHCRYIYQLCNHSEIEKLFDSVYDDFRNEGALKLWEELKQKEIDYRQQLQINLAQEIIDIGLSVKQVQNKVKSIKNHH